jgi:Tfp pilus assembly protein PilF
VQLSKANSDTEHPYSTLSRSRIRGWILGSALILMVVAAYSYTLSCGYIWDDDDWVVNNPMLNDLAGLKTIWFKVKTNYQYYPFVYSSFWIERRIWGLNPMGYHAVNVILHASSAVLFWRVLENLKFRGAWLAAALFAVHPVGVESVAWITERKNVLSAVFYLGAALLYVRYAGLNRHSDLASHNKEQSSLRRCYVGAFLLFVAALLSKTVTCSLPAALILLTWWKEGRLSWSMVKPTFPFFAIGMAFGLTTAWLERTQVGATGDEWTATFAERTIIAGRAVWFYAGKLLWPQNLAFSYERWAIDVSDWRQWLFPTAAIAIVAALWLGRHRVGRGPLVAVLFFGGTLFPALGFINVYPMRFSFVADHFQYHASLGLLALGGWIFTRALARLSQPLARVAIQASLLGLLGWVTWQQTQVYLNVETLWRDTLRKTPDSFLAHHNLASYLQGTGQVEPAIQHYRQAAKIYPDCVTLMNLAFLLHRNGQYEEALVYYSRAFSLPVRPANSKYLCMAATDYGELLMRAGKPQEATGVLGLALTLDSTNTRVLMNLGHAFAAGAQHAEAAQCFSSVTIMEPSNAEAYYGLGTALAMMGQVDEALTQYRKVSALLPNNADVHNNIGSLLASRGRTAEAVLEFEAALRITPTHQQAGENLKRAKAEASESPRPAPAPYPEPPQQ